LAAAEITKAMVSAAYGATAAQPKQRDDDPFRKGDFVVYPTHGVGKIDKIGSEEIGGHKLDLISISFDENKMTLRVPVAQARVTGLRKLATPEVMAQAMTILAGRPKASRLMWAKRAQEYQAKINSGEPVSLAEVVRDLQAASDGSSSFSQRNLFELALDRLAAEFAAASNTDKPTAIARITEAMQQARKTSAAQASDAAKASGAVPEAAPEAAPEAVQADEADAKDAD
jgi:CarD family transcriptional regulator